MADDQNKPKPGPPKPFIDVTKKEAEIIGTPQPATPEEQAEIEETEHRYFAVDADNTPPVKTVEERLAEARVEENKVPDIAEYAKSPEIEPSLKAIGIDGVELTPWQAQKSPDRYLLKAKRFVVEYLNSQGTYQRKINPNEVYILSFSKTEHDWVATIKTVHRDKFFFQVTYNGHEGETTLDIYQLLTTSTIQD